MNSEIINEAIQDYIGFGSAVSPKNNAQLVEEKFGFGVKEVVVKIISELNEVPINWEHFDLLGASKFAVESIYYKYNLLDAKTRSAMEWKFSYDWR